MLKLHDFCNRAGRGIVGILRREAGMESEIGDAEADRLEDGRKLGIERAVYED
ncbi:hypothetical protein [Sphingobium indicum]|uniref:hypothetical protein n=1 Tax=Sphingobium indicum TaxID=332055 RepID=UPI00157D4D71|nr:hypothetical protein [Sphingobium indicum]